MKNNAAARKWLNYLPVLLFGLIYLAFGIYRLLYYPINFDEGSYAYKGYAFISGDYQPFQDYGFWTNKMPLAFLVPGLFQHIYPGILTGRLLALAFGLIALAGSYCLANRLAGRKAALLVIAVSAFSLSMITNYSMAITQSMTAALLLWAFYFITQDEGKPWRVYLGSLLLLLAVFTRQNMIFALPVVWLYVILQKKAGNNFIYTGVLLLAFIGLHLPFWPNIRMVWADSVPLSLHFIDAWRSPGLSYLSATLSTPSALEQIRSVAETFLTHGVSFLGGLWGIVVLLRKQRPRGWQEIALLTGSFWLLVIAHGLGTIGSKAMNWGFSNLFDFFGLLGVVIFSVLLASKTRGAGLVGVTALPALGFSLGSYYQELLPSHWEKILVPYFSFSKFSFKTMLAGDLVIRFGAPSTQAAEPWLLPAIGAVLGLVIVVIWAAAVLVFRKKIKKPGLILIWAALLVALTAQPVGWALDLNDTRGCWPNAVAQDRQMRSQLGTAVTEEVVVLMTSTDDLNFIVGLKQLEVPPASVNRPWGERLDAGEDELLRAGLYNQAIVDGWYRGVDYLLLNPQYVPTLPVEVWACYQEVGTAQFDSHCGTQRKIQVLRNTCH